jgi:hypothetical protein
MGSSNVDIEDAAPDSPPTPTCADIVAMELAHQIEDAEKPCGAIRHQQQSLVVAKAAALNVLGEEVDNQRDAIQRPAKDRAEMAERAERQANKRKRWFQRDTSTAPSSDTAGASKGPSKLASGSSTALPPPFSPAK